MVGTLKVGQTDARFNIILDYVDGTQVSLSYLQNASALAIEYEWKKDNATLTTPTTGSWIPANYGLWSDSRPYIYYEFNGTDAVPSDAEGWLEIRAKVTSQAGRVSYGDTVRIKVIPNEVTNG